MASDTLQFTVAGGLIFYCVIWAFFTKVERFRKISLKIKNLGIIAVLIGLPLLGSIEILKWVNTEFDSSKDLTVEVCDT